MSRKATYKFIQELKDTARIVLPFLHSKKIRGNDYIQRTELCSFFNCKDTQLQLLVALHYLPHTVNRGHGKEFNLSESIERLESWTHEL